MQGPSLERNIPMPQNMLAAKSLESRKGSGRPGGRWAEHEPAEPSSSKEGQQPPVLRWEEHPQQAQGGDSPL